MFKKKQSLKNIYKLNKLNTAIVINDTNIIMELLENNIDLNSPDAHGWYPLMYAVEYGNVEVLKLLIEHGANPNVIDKRTGYSLLMQVLSQKYYPNRYLIIKELLKHGTDVNIVGYNSRTALYLAKLYHPRYINMLKRYGAEF